MYHRVGVRAGLGVGEWLARAIGGRFMQPVQGAALADGAVGLRLLPWFSIAGVAAVVLFCLAFGLILSYFLTRENLIQDASLTSQFITSVERVQSREAQLGEDVTLGQLLDHRSDFVTQGVAAKTAASVRTQYFDHIRVMPDLRLAIVYGRDRSILWSTNPTLRGQVDLANVKLREAFATRHMVMHDSFGGARLGHLQRLGAEQDTPFIDLYIPLLGSRGEVVAVVEILKEPHSLLQSIHRGKQLIWLSIALGALVLYLVPFWIFRCADGALGEQQMRLREAETLCLIGEMSAAVAHGIRNPLATIRTSAELALDADPEAARGNAKDIITQVDRLGKWVRELLVFSRPVTGDIARVDVKSLVDECLLNVSTQLQKNRIACDLKVPSVVPPVVGCMALAQQALASLVSNAVEAMPDSGVLQVRVQVAAGHVDIIVQDSGVGMSATQMALVFKPFYTTKRNGLGLGLAQVRRIMQRFGGAVWLRSREGQGTTACLRFRVGA